MHDLERAALAHLSVAELKEKGNLALTKLHHNHKAIISYSLAIAKDMTVKEIWSNRSLANLNSNNFQKALLDSDKVILLDPNWSRGYVRKVASLNALKRPKEAKQEHLIHELEQEHLHERRQGTCSNPPTTTHFIYFWPGNIYPHHSDKKRNYSCSTNFFLIQIYEQYNFFANRFDLEKITCCIEEIHNFERGRVSLSMQSRRRS
eukprot:TRINITY_DN7129_c0_g1_i4.p3 TRINITY_DN7129_c0_g1~~TRINITY_DN7129_c0_g1_i4.p3  ORF type:complete len:205 (-),score=43.77 TRINITY_DN7129_c0_g1_i4:661-1275(-)